MIGLHRRERRLPLRRFDLPLIPGHARASGDVDRHVVVVLKTVKLRPLLVLEVVGHLMGDVDADQGGGPLDRLCFDLAVGVQGRVFERGAHPPTPAERAGRVADLLDRRLLLLARELQDTELGDVGKLDPCPVQGNGFFEGLLHLRVVLVVHHVDEVDDDQPPEIAQTELASDLFRRLHVRLVGGLLNVPLVGAPPRVDVDCDHRLRWIDDQIAARLQLHVVLIDYANLIFQLVFVEERGLFLVQFDHLEIPWSNGLAIGPHLAEGFQVVNENLLDVRGEIIPQRADAKSAFLVDQGGSCRFGGPFLDLLPEARKVLVVAGQLLFGPVHPGCPDDKSNPVFRFDLFNKLLEALAILLVLDLPGDAAALLVGKQNQVAPRQGDVSGQQSALAFADLPHDLDENLLTGFER